jgi:hypothetical protein
MKLTPVTTADLPDVGAACQLGPDGRPLYASLWLTPNPWGECVQATTRVLVKLPKLREALSGKDRRVGAAVSD